MCREKLNSVICESKLNVAESVLNVPQRWFYRWFLHKFTIIGKLKFVCFIKALRKNQMEISFIELSVVRESLVC